EIELVFFLIHHQQRPDIRAEVFRHFFHNGLQNRIKVERRCQRLGDIMEDGQLLGQANWGRARCLRHELLSSSGWIRNYKFGRAARATNVGNEYLSLPTATILRPNVTAETPRAQREQLAIETQIEA